MAEYISLQEAVWRTLNLLSPCLASDKKTARAQAKLHALSLCEVMENKFDEFAKVCTTDPIVKKMETNLYYTKKPQREVTTLPANVVMSFVMQNIAMAHKEYFEKFERAFDKIFKANPDMNRLTPEEIKAIEEEPESEGDNDGLSEADDEEY